MSLLFQRKRVTFRIVSVPWRENSTDSGVIRSCDSEFNTHVPYFDRPVMVQDNMKFTCFKPNKMSYVIKIQKNIVQDPVAFAVPARKVQFFIAIC